jgi:hypothetical protein
MKYVTEQFMKIFVSAKFVSVPTGLEVFHQQTALFLPYIYTHYMHLLYFFF